VRSSPWCLRYRIVAISALLTAVRLIVEAALEPPGLIPLLLLLWRNTRYKYRWAWGASRSLWLPMAWYVGLVARLGGFASGWVARRRGASRSPSP
jgi:hypothetical protein